MEFLTLLFRTVIIYFVVFLIMRLMGKRKIGISSPEPEPITDPLGSYNLEKQNKQVSVSKPTSIDGSPKYIRLESLPIPIIMEGKVVEHGLEMIGKTRFWLKQELGQKGISSAKEVYFCSVNHKGDLFVDAIKKKLP